jgi:hypothetical protein
VPNVRPSLFVRPVQVSTFMTLSSTNVSSCKHCLSLVEITMNYQKGAMTAIHKVVMGVVAPAKWRMDTTV